MKNKRVLGMILASTTLLSSFATSASAVNVATAINEPTMVSSAKAASANATLTVDMSPSANTGEIIHGAAGFLYGVSSEDVPTTNTMVPLKSKILVTKGALGTEHPYGDTLDVAKTFLESGGQQIQMYNSNYYGVFGVTATTDQYCEDLKNYICPAIVEWKKAWNEEHGTPENPKDNLGATIDIDQAIVYVPINEGTPNGGNFQESWKKFYEAIKSVDKNANLAGPNSAAYNTQFTWGQNNQTFIQFCADNNCMPDVITWHELQTDKLQAMGNNMDNFKDIWNNKIDWTKYNEANGTTGTPEIPQICINEYAEMEYCGVPGRLVNWMARLEDEKITGCLPFWHQANNLNDLAASANEGNGAWWLYQWYGNMSGTTQPVTTSSNYYELYGLSTMDEAKRLSTTLLGGWTGDVTVQLNNVTSTETFKGDKCVDVTVEEAVYNGIHSPITETSTVVSGTFPVNEDGSVTINIPNTLFESAYKVTVTESTATEADLPVLVGNSGDVYEAEKAQLSGGATATAASSNPSYYMSGTGNRAASMPSGSSMTYTIDVPVNGKYRLDFIYGNGQGTTRNNMNAHNPVNAIQTFSVDGGDVQEVTLESTLFHTMTGSKTLYYDLTAGEHTITVTTSDKVKIDNDMLLHDFVRVSYAAAYGEDVVFNRVYEAELADFSKLLGNTDSTVTTQTDIDGYSGSGYVKGLSKRSVEKGGGIRYTVVVEDSGLYNLSLRYKADSAGSANIYVGNTATTLDRVNKTVNLTAGDDWQTVTASVYLQKGINVVDLDTTVDAAVDYLRVREVTDNSNSTTIEAENTTLSEGVTTATSAGASGGEYVVGMKGSYNDQQYLEFTYNAPAAGKYQMQIFHSNEDLAGSHDYNIKAIDKYATFEVNGESDSPVFDEIEYNDNQELLYFVDCGDHNPETVSDGDSFGKLNPSATDQIYPESTEGYDWGVVLENENEKVLTPAEGVSRPSIVGEEAIANDKAVYTTYQRAQSDNAWEFEDNQDKTKTFRYAHGQDTAGINPRYISYAFELDPGTYEVTVGMGNNWGGFGSPTVTLSSGDTQLAQEAYNVPNGGSTEKTMTITLTEDMADADKDGKIELSVKATSTQNCVLMNYISIQTPKAELPENAVELVGGTIVDGDKLSEYGYVGELAPNFNTFVDYRNLKNETTRYFFINTFSDDTFREKTITLDLKQGENKIRVYNDNSWNVTYGGTQNSPGLNELPNYTPNFDKFVITPMALDSAAEQDEQYLIDISTNQGGLAWTDKTYVNANGEYTVNISSNGLAPTVYINGKEQKVTDNGDNTYTLTVSGVNQDQKIGVYFILSAENLEKLCAEAGKLKQSDYTSNSWANLKTALDNANAALESGQTTAIERQMLYEALENAINGLYTKVKGLTYFVDCGDHNPATITGMADDFGSNNSVTDKHFGEDEKTGFEWGLVTKNENEKVLTPKDGVSEPTKISEEALAADKGIYTTYQKAQSNNSGNLSDGQDKNDSFIYAHGQDTAGINPRYVSYAFELEPGQYEVTVGMGNSWNNAKNPTVTLSVGEEELAKETYSINSDQDKTMTIDLSDKTENVILNVDATSSDATIQMNYIQIVRKDIDSEPEDVAVTGVTLDKTSATLKEGGTVELKATVTPDNASNKAVKWSTSDEKIATVDENGKVTAVSAGTATITVTTVDGAKTATCAITVEKQSSGGGSTGGGSSSGGSSSGGSSTTIDEEDIPLVENPTGAVELTDGKPVKVEKDNAVVEITADKTSTGYDIKLEKVEGTLKDGVLIALPTTETSAGTVAVIVDANGKETVVKTSYLEDSKLVLAVDKSCKIKIEDRSKSFTDVSSNYWGKDAIAFATSHDLFNGTSETEFSPETAMTRGMIVTVLARYEGVDTSNSNPWYQKGIDWAIENGISDGSNPENKLTREQLATMLYRYAGSPKVNGAAQTFTDSNKISSWASDAMNWAIQNGLISGMGDGTVNPQGEATRAQVATIIQRFIMN